MNILEHTIRNILSGIKEEQPIDEMGLPGGTDKFQGSQFAGASSKTVTPKIRPGHNEGAEKAANARNTQKAKASQTMHNKVHEEKESEGTKERRKVTNVGRPWTASSNFDSKSKLAKQTEIKTKIIDEGKKLAGIVKDTVKEKKSEDQDPIEITKTIVYPQVIMNPPIKSPDNNRDS